MMKRMLLSLIVAALSLAAVRASRRTDAADSGVFDSRFDPETGGLAAPCGRASSRSPACSRDADAGVVATQAIVDDC